MNSLHINFRFVPFAQPHRAGDFDVLRLAVEKCAELIRAVERNRAEVEVAPLGLRLGAGFANLAPELAASISRLMGGERVASDLAEGQKTKR